MTERVIRGMITETVAGRTKRELDMVFRFADMLENPPRGFIHDTSLLPYPKDKLLLAFRSQIGRHEDRNMVELMSAAALSLSQYQEGVGKPSLDYPAAVDSQDQLEDEAKLMEILAGFSDPRFVHYQALQHAETQEIYELVQKAKASNPIMRKTFWQRLFRR